MSKPKFNQYLKSILVLLIMQNSEFILMPNWSVYLMRSKICSGDKSLKFPCFILMNMKLQFIEFPSDSTKVYQLSSSFYIRSAPTFQNFFQKNISQTSLGIPESFAFKNTFRKIFLGKWKMLQMNNFESKYKFMRVTCKTFSVREKKIQK